MKVQYKHLSKDIKQSYKLDEKVTLDNCIYINIKKGDVWLETSSHPGIQST